MIQASELRIGNWVALNDRDGDKRNVKVLNIEERGINVYTTSYSVELEGHFLEDRSHDGKWIEGIPLTPKILEKAGFEKDDEYNCLYLSFGLFKICTWMDGSVRFSVEEYNCKKISYVHQLQNLYFVLTNEELNIEL